MIPSRKSRLPLLSLTRFAQICRFPAILIEQCAGKTVVMVGPKYLDIPVEN